MPVLVAHASARSVALTTILACITLSNAESSVAKNMSKSSRFLQSSGYREHPKMPECPAGYIDRTSGTAYHWECGHHCPVMHWTDSCCYCACVRPSDPLANEAACGHPAANAPAQPASSQPTNVLAFTQPVPAPSGFAAPAPPPRQQSTGSEDAGVPTGVVMLLVVLGIAGFLILCCAMALSMRGSPKLERVTPADIPAAKQPDFKMPPPVVARPPVAMPNYLPNPTAAGKTIPSIVSTPSTITPRSNVTAQTQYTHASAHTQYSHASAHTSYSNASVPVRAPQGTFLSTQDLRTAGRSRSLSPRPNSDTSFQPQDLASNRARSASPRPRFA